MQDTANPPTRFVIPPGQEGVIRRMLNVPAGLDGGWRFERATIEQSSIDGYYRGQSGERARIILRRIEDAPEGWRRTGQFALGLSADPPGKSAVTLYRAVLAAVRDAEDAFAWQETMRPDAPASADDSAAAGRSPTEHPGEALVYAQRARAAEAELDLHLDHTPFVDLGIEFDHAGAFAEALALLDRFVVYQSDPSYGVTGWRGLALQALDGDATRVATTDDDAGVYEDQSRYRLTDVAELCPITMSLLERLFVLDQCRTVSFLLLDPGARIHVHIDGVGPPVMRSVNVALNMPAGCRLVIDSNPDGSDYPYTRTVPFRDGSAFLMNVAKYHYVVNDSAVPRIHVVARGALRIPVLDLLARAEAQDGMVGLPAVEAALEDKRRALGETPAVQADVAAATGAATDTGPALSAFVSTLSDAAGERVLALLDLGDHALVARVGAANNGSSEWCVEVDVQLPSGDMTILDLQAVAPERPAWFRTANLAVSYRARGADPLADPRNDAFVAALRERLNRLDPPGLSAPAPPIADLLAELDRIRPFLPVQDKDYRIVFSGGTHPVGILWLGFQCNQDCRMCWQGREWPAPPDEMFDRWLDEFRAADVSNVILSGGEPTLHPRLSDWLRRAAGTGMYATLETNAIRFTEPVYLRELLAAGLNSVVVSLHAADPAVSDALTMTPGSHALTVAGTVAALDAGIDVGVHCVVERANVAGLEAHANFVAHELRAGDHAISHVSYSFPIGYRRAELYRDGLAPLDELRPHLSAAVRILREQGIHVSFLGTSGFTPCAYDDPESLAPLLPDMATEEMREGRMFVEICAGCSLRARCLGLHKAYVDQHGGRGAEPVG